MSGDPTDPPEPDPDEQISNDAQDSADSLPKVDLSALFPKGPSFSDLFPKQPLFADLLPKVDLSALFPKGPSFSDLIPKVDFSGLFPSAYESFLIPRIDSSGLFPRIDVSSLLEQLNALTPQYQHFDTTELHYVFDQDFVYAADEESQPRVSAEYRAPQRLSDREIAAMLTTFVFLVVCIGMSIAIQDFSQIAMISKVTGASPFDIAMGVGALTFWVSYSRRSGK